MLVVLLYYVVSASTTHSGRERETIRCWKRRGVPLTNFEQAIAISQKFVQILSRPLYIVYCNKSKRAIKKV